MRKTKAVKYFPVPGIIELEDGQTIKRSDLDDFYVEKQPGSIGILRSALIRKRHMDHTDLLLILPPCG